MNQTLGLGNYLLIPLVNKAYLRDVLRIDGCFDESGMAWFPDLDIIRSPVLRMKEEVFNRRLMPTAK